MRKHITLSFLVFIIFYSCKVTDISKKEELTFKENCIKQVILVNKDFFKANYFLAYYPLDDFDSIDFKGIDYIKKTKAPFFEKRTPKDNAKKQLLFCLKSLKEKDTVYIKNQLVANKTHFLTKKLIGNKALLTKATYKTLLEKKSNALEGGVNAISNPIFNKAKTKALVTIYYRNIVFVKGKLLQTMLKTKGILYKYEKGKWLRDSM